MKNLYSLILLMGLFAQQSFSQATWELTPKGIAYPRYTDANRPTGTITIGTTIFNTTQNVHQYWNGSAWTNLATGGGGSNYWQLSGVNGDEITNSNTGGFWSKNPVGLDFYLSTNTTNPPTAPISGAGTRMMWIPSRSAFRVGTVSASSPTIWDSANIGLYSFASGYSVKASGSNSIAMGLFSTASGGGAIAMGYAINSSGDASTAIGYATTASGDRSTAMGAITTASGFISTAIGSNAMATGDNSIAIGNNVTASGYYSTAMGIFTTASGNSSTAMGYGANTNFKAYSFAISSYFTNTRAVNDKAGQMKMHFDDFRFLTGTTNDFAITDGQVSTTNTFSVYTTVNRAIGGYGFLSPSGSTGYASTSPVPHSMYASSRILAQEFNAFSDARHKKLLSRGNGASDLALLNQLKVSNYTFIDTVGKGKEIQMGFIAQEVEKIVPNAVKKLQDYIPSIYDMAERLVYDAKLKTLTITTKKPHNFQAKGEIKLISLEKEHKVKADKIIDAHTFVVNNWEKSLNKIFVFGKQVNDFRTVDYDRLFTLGISSIQELSRKIDALEKENQLLKAKNQEFDFLKKDVAELKAMLLK